MLLFAWGIHTEIAAALSARWPLARYDFADGVMAITDKQNASCIFAAPQFLPHRRDFVGSAHGHNRDDYARASCAALDYATRVLFADACRWAMSMGHHRRHTRQETSCDKKALTRRHAYTFLYIMPRDAIADMR